MSKGQWQTIVSAYRSGNRGPIGVRLAYNTRMHQMSILKPNAVCYVFDISNAQFYPAWL
jgi:hypothetical protein